MNGQNRDDIRLGMEVLIVLKEDQGTDNLTKGIVKDILTNASFHPRDIKVRLKEGRVSRVQKIL